MTDKYMLNGHEIVPVSNALVWAKWFERADRRVAKTYFDGCFGWFYVSTVFLGLDHRFGDDGPPLLFETMVFKDNDWGEELCEQCSTWEEAERQHRRIAVQAWEHWTLIGRCWRWLRQIVRRRG